MRMSLPSRAIVYLLVLLSVLVVVFPLLWMLLSAVKTNGEIINPHASLFPTDWHWSNIKQAWEAAPFGRYFLNTAVFSVVTTIGQVATGLLAGYAFAMFDFPLRRVLFYLVLSGLMIPFTVVIVPVVQIVADLHWINTYQGLIVPNLASALGAFLFRQFFLGARRWNSARRPASTARGSSGSSGASTARSPAPITAAFTMIAFLQNWNNFLFPLVVTDSQSKMLLSQGLTVFQSDPINKYSYNLLMAGSLIAVVPVLIVAMVAQRRIVDGLALGAVK